MPELRIDFEVWCSCGKGLCRQSTVKGMDVTIEPCENCLSRAREEGYNKGHNEGYDEGYGDGVGSAES